MWSLDSGDSTLQENFLKSIGFFTKDGGIEELLTESGVCKRGTANKVIAGRDYHKMVKCHTLVRQWLVSPGTLLKSGP